MAPSVFKKHWGTGRVRLSPQTLHTPTSVLLKPSCVLQLEQEFSTVCHNPFGGSIPNIYITSSNSNGIIVMKYQPNNFLVRSPYHMRS